MKLGSNKESFNYMYTIGPLTEVNMVRSKRFNVNFFLIRITNWGARMPKNTFWWRWLSIEDFCTPPPHTRNLLRRLGRGGVWRVGGESLVKSCNLLVYEILGAIIITPPPPHTFLTNSLLSLLKKINKATLTSLLNKKKD